MGLSRCSFVSRARLIGVFILTVGLDRQRSYRLGGAKTGVFTQALEATVKYWHSVDVAWVFSYPTLYLVG